MTQASLASPTMPAASAPAPSGPAPVRLDVGTGNSYRIDRYQDPSGATRFAVINNDNGTLAALFNRGQTLELTGNGQGSSLTIPADIERLMGSKPLIRTAQQNRSMPVAGPHDFVAPIESISTQLAEMFADAMKPKEDMSKVQAQFNHQLSTLKDPQIAMALAMRDAKRNKPVPEDTTPGNHDLNNIEIPGLGPLGGLMQRLKPGGRE